MQWIFDPCPDVYGLCIRQYVICSISFLISIFSIVSVIKTCKSPNKTSKIQLGPLTINFLATFFIFILYLAFEQFYNTHLLVIVIQIYSYFLIAYAYRILYLNSEPIIRPQKIKQVNVIFLLITSTALVSVIAISIFSLLGQIKCRSQYGIGTLIVFIVELPIYILTLFVCRKTKKRLNQLAQNKEQIRAESLRLFVQMDQQIRLKIVQTNLVIITFTVTMMLHIVYLFLFLVFDEEMICQSGTNKIVIHNWQQLFLMSIENISEIFPYLMIPIIFWYIPQKISQKTSTQYHILISKRQLSLDQRMNMDEQNYVRQKLLEDGKQ